MSPLLPLRGCSHQGVPHSSPRPQLELGCPCPAGRVAAAGAQGSEGLGALCTTSLAARLINTRSRGMSLAAGERGRTQACSVAFPQGSHRWAAPRGCGLTAKLLASWASLGAGFSPSFCSSPEVKLIWGRLAHHPSMSCHILQKGLFALCCPKPALIAPPGVHTPAPAH